MNIDKALSNLKKQIKMRDNIDYDSAPKLIDELATEIHDNAYEHGFWDCPTCNGKGMIEEECLGNSVISCPICNGTGKYRNDSECIALIHSEVSEALEELRKQPRNPKEGIEPVYYWDDKTTKPEGWAVELADCVIRILDYVKSKNINNFEEIIKVKMDYNKSRPYKHNKQF
jgi:RecJ-like exonuclease